MIQLSHDYWKKDSFDDMDLCQQSDPQLQGSLSSLQLEKACAMKTQCNQK